MDDPASNSATSPSSNGLPDWVSRLGVPTWVSGPDRRMCYVNGRAEQLFALSAGEAIDRFCYLVVDGCDVAGHPTCGPRCALLQAAEAGQDIEPVTVQVRVAGGERRWVQVLCVPVYGADGNGPWLVHCAIDRARTQRIQDYLQKVAARSPGDGDPNGRPDRGRRLTPREWEVLQLLADDVELTELASRLHLSLVTVRNHVQHILAKLGVHSILEAIALFLLGRIPSSQLPR